MDSKYALGHVSDRELVDGLTQVVADNDQSTALMLAHVGEVDARRLYLPRAFSSMFQYCLSVMNFEEGKAYNAIHAARAARKYPEIFELVATGAQPPVCVADRAR